MRIRQSIDSAEEELLRSLPKDFIHTYVLLLELGYRFQDSQRMGMGNANSVVVKNKGGLGTTKSGVIEQRLKAKRSAPSTRAASKDPIRYEGAIYYRRKIDKRLRHLAREIKSWIETLENNPQVIVNRCTGAKCRKLGEQGWKFCPRCGSAMISPESE